MRLTPKVKKLSGESADVHDLFGRFRDRQTLGKRVLHLSNSQSFRVLEGSRCSRETVAVVIRRMATSTFIQLRRHMAGVER